MAGFREFVTGEVLTAANVDDFLAKQAVMKFADAAARDAALGTAVAGGNALREGMVAYLDSTDEVIKYDGTAWAAIAAAGIGSNVVQTVKTDTFSVSIGALAWSANVTGLEVTITPTSSTSKILVTGAMISHVTVAVGGAYFRLVRDGTAISVGDSGGVSATTANNVTTEQARANNVVWEFLDSPATTSPVTYGVQIYNSSGESRTHFVNRTTTDNGRFVSSITAIEVAA
jgi:hypothetical protein